MGAMIDKGTKLAVIGVGICWVAVGGSFFGEI